MSKKLDTIWKMPAGVATGMFSAFDMMKMSHIMVFSGSGFTVLKGFSLDGTCLFLAKLSCSVQVPVPGYEVEVQEWESIIRHTAGETELVVSDKDLFLVGGDDGRKICHHLTAQHLHCVPNIPPLPEQDAVVRVTTPRFLAWLLEGSETGEICFSVCSQDFYVGWTEEERRKLDVEVVNVGGDFSATYRCELMWGLARLCLLGEESMWGLSDCGAFWGNLEVPGGATLSVGIAPLLSPQEAARLRGCVCVKEKDLVS